MTLARYVAPASLLLAGVVHLLPLSGALGTETLHALYGIDAAEPNLQLLLRHRAILFGLLGAVLLAGAVHSPLRPAAFSIGLGSVLSFVALAALSKGLSPQLAKVVVVDLIVAVALVVGISASITTQRHGTT